MQTRFFLDVYPLVNVLSGLVVFFSSLYVYILLFRYRSKISDEKIAGQDVAFVRTAILAFALIVASNGISHLISSISSIYSCTGLLNLERVLAALVVAPSAMYMYSVTNSKSRSVYKIMRSAKKYETVFNKAPIGLAIVSGEGFPVEMNETLAEFLGYSPEDIMGMHFKDFTHPEDVEKDLDLFSKLISGEIDEYTIAKRYIHGVTGEILYAKLGVFLIRNGITEVVATVTDINTEMRASHEIEVKAAELELLNRELERFAYVSSHDLQEPLRTVKMFSGLLERSLEEKISDEEREYIEHMRRASTRMQHLIKDLLEYSRLARNSDAYKMVDMQEIFLDAVSSLAAFSVSHHADVVVDMRGSIVNGNEVQLVSLATNLLSNAMKFHAEGVLPSVTASYYQDGDAIVYFVQDNGIGIEEEYRDKVFDVFSRLHSQNDYSGTGIGLSICDKIVKSHGGNIWIEGNESGGTTVKFTLGCVN